MAEGNMVDASTRQAVLYVLMGLYLFSLLVVAKLAHRRKTRARASGAELQAHFGGSFNAPLLLLTTFSTVYSGFTVTGIPDEAAKRGFVSLRWIGATIVIAASMMLLYPRLRRLSVERQYTNPNDFIADRFGTSRLRLATAFCGVIPMVIYITAQLISFASMVQGFTYEALPRWAAMLLLIALLLIFEHLGGMNSVVFTDAVQSCIMLLSFLVVPFVLGGVFGFLPAMSPADCPHLMYVQHLSAGPDVAPGACPSTGPGCVPAGCIQAVKEDFFAYPTHKDQADIAFFLLNMLAAPLQPHMIQRSFIASSDGALRIMMGAMVLAPFLAQTPGIVIGLTQAAYSPSWPEEERKLTAFSGVSNALASVGLGPYFLVSVMTCATMAAIMSTADSAILGASSLTVDIYRSMYDPSAPERRLVNIGACTSVAMCIIAFGMAMLLSSTMMGEILIFQNGMLMQLLPSFGLGLYSSVSEQAVTGGLFAGLLSLVALVAAGDKNLLAPVPLVNASVFVNFAVVGLVQLAVAMDVMKASGIGASRTSSSTRASAATAEASEQQGQKATLDMRSGQLTPDGIRSIVAKVGEPNKPLLALMLFAMIFSVPWYRAPKAEEPIVWGLPRWGLVQVMIFVFTGILGVAAAISWQPMAQAAPAEEDWSNVACSPVGGCRPDDISTKE